MASSSGSNVGSSSNGPGTGYDRGVPLNLASYHEWEIAEIGYDGTEKFKIPHGYQEHIGALARKIDWMGLAGQDSRVDNIKEKEKEVDAAAVVEEAKKKAIAEGNTERIPPDAGPWHVVAKHLHESLQQLTVLLDDLAILRTTDYLKPMRVADPLHDPMIQHEVTQMVQNSKAFQWNSKRKALTEAAEIFHQALSRRRNHVGVDHSSRRNTDLFFMELRRLRKLWRVRKYGENIVGDLGYKMFGIKHDPRGMFQISRLSSDKYTRNMRGELEINVLQVTVPSDLMRQSSLNVSIVKDDGSTTNVFPEKPDSEYAYMDTDKSESDALPWETVLKRAQETLICKDIFNSLSQEAVQLQRRISVVKEGVVLVSLYDDYLLRIELKYYPFTMELLPTEGNPFLTRFLREYHLAMECTRPVRPQMLVDLPLTHLPEGLDYRGPLAYSVEDMESRSTKPKGLLTRLIQVASHYQMVKKTTDVLKDHQNKFADPTFRFRCVRCSPLHSLFLCELSNRGYDHVAGKLSFYVQVDIDSVTVQTKEGTDISCRRNEWELRQALHLMSATHEMLSVSCMAKQVFYQVLHGNMNAMDENGVPCPTLYLVNAASTRSFFVKFPMGEVPETYIRDFIADEREATEEDKKFTPLNYLRIPGRSLCKKFDILFTMLRN